MKLFNHKYLLLTILSLTFVAYSCSDSGTGPEVDPPQEFNSQAAPGDSAKSFLEGDQYTSLQVEIDYMPGHQPTQAGLDSLRTFLQKHLNKQNITFRTPTEIPSGGLSSYTASDIRSLEDEHRQHVTEAGDDALQAYFLYVDGQFNDGEGGGSNVLGIAYWNTSTAYFGQTIEDVSSGIGAPSEEKIEGTVFRHEFGHIMGLVGNGTPTQSAHQEQGAHCTEDGCLMEAAVETTDFFANTFDGDIPDLLQFCNEDLNANGGK